MHITFNYHYYIYDPTHTTFTCKKMESTTGFSDFTRHTLQNVKYVGVNLTGGLFVFKLSSKKVIHNCTVLNVNTLKLQDRK